MEIYAAINKETVENALERVRVEINALTNGEAQKAIDLVKEHNELARILEQAERR